MKAVVQRVSRARVASEGVELASIGPGMLILVCAVRGDGAGEAQRLAERIARFRFFPDADGKMNLSALDRGLEMLVVSQFTLSADGKRGRRPSFDRALEPRAAEALCERFAATLRTLGLRTLTGRFGTRMQVELVNDGPVTFVLEEESAAPDAPPE
jgi:D-tyrosyl-tRNA(Tyr) deacylase